MRFLLISLILPVVAATPKSLPDPEEAAYPAIERLVEVMEQVRARHPDVDKLAYDRLVNHALEGMLASLDPHSSFIHPEMAAMMKEQPDLDPHVAALGLTMGWRGDGPYLAAVEPGSAAAELLPGSALLEIDGRPVAGLPATAVLGQLSGAPGSKVTLRLKSPAEPRAEEVVLTRRAVEERAVTDFRLLEAPGSAGYLRLASFTDAAPREIEAALDELEEKGMKSLVLDLRGNPGGSLPATVEILGFFLPPGTEVVTVRAREGSGDNEALRTPERQRRKREYPIAILIDRGSASASELTAGALQDLKRAKVIGELSYGKGSVQNIIPTGGNTALRLTIATYHTPSGKTPHRVGIQPDIAVEIGDEDRTRTGLSFRKAQLTPEEAAELEKWTDPVLSAALEALASP